MFPLYTHAFPKSAAELERLLNESLGRLFATTSKPVSIRDEAYPKIIELQLSLDGAELRAHPPRPPASQFTTSPALSIGSLQIKGTGVAIGPAILNLKLAARDVRLSQSRDANDELILLLQSAADGEIEISAEKEVIERAISETARQEAAKHGVTIDQVQLTIRSRGARALDAEVQLRARKLFFSTIIRIAAKLDLDEQLNAAISDVRCSGDGPIGSVACGFLTPHLQKVDGRSFPLMALPIGEVRLRDVRLDAGDRITVNAKFGA